MYFSGGIKSPTGCEELVAFDLAAVVDALCGAGLEVAKDLAPDDIAVALGDYVRVAAVEGFFGEERGVDAPYMTVAPRSWAILPTW